MASGMEANARIFGFDIPASRRLSKSRKKTGTSSPVAASTPAFRAATHTAVRLANYRFGREGCKAG